MGARTYLSQIGRFAQVDPVNDLDLTGQINWHRIEAAIAIGAQEYNKSGNMNVSTPVYTTGLATKTLKRFA